ncbi:N-acetylmuramic acid 6-phosphate etherase [Nitratireductor kimnyeongensis]|uniref:N-acetylmuramic acid 6-phosphate etherase n=1 Tax=Nitratireductor kimnyeongensis TaxID=430679 RepID=A0ABW0TC79_9HYPH|nr:N-acetylmuramic acid 6-phosphate etherase [Nitratireductor kimnyeongensis]QZZ37012.1 N-acetylmuramic acid 6-phosphate etherase [Nitratireductor kimnyeongensis]
MTTATETASQAYRDIERFSTADMLNAMLDGQRAAMDAASAALPALEEAVEAAVQRLANPESRLIYAGAGTSGRVAMLDAVELYPTFGWPEERSLFLLAGGSISVAEARESAEDDEAAGRDEIDALACGPLDVVIGLAASGSTPYTLAAIEAAKARGALTIGIANNPGSALLESADCPVLLATGAEVLAGSTRMGAGTSQKIAINLFSTAVMMRLGKVYRGRMVDMKPSNRKLVQRAVEMLTEVADCDEGSARAALEKTDFHVKPAVLVVRGLSAEEAHVALERNGDDLHRAIAELG